MSVRVRVLLLLLAAFAAAPARGAEPAAETDIPMAPVVIDGQVLFELRGASSLPATARAERVRQRIEDLAADPGVRPEDVQVVRSGDYLLLAAGDRVVVTLVDADAQANQVSLGVLADLYRDRIVRAIREWREQRDPGHLVRAALTVLAATAALAIVAFLVVWATRRLDASVERRFHRRIKALEVKSFQLVRLEQVRAALHNLLRGARLVALLALALLYLQFVLSLFPWTRGYADPVLHVVIDPLQKMAWSLLRNVPNLVFLALLFVVVRFILRAMHVFFDTIGRGALTFAGFDREWALPTYKIARVAVVAFALVVAYPYIPGSESDAFKGVSLFLGVVFSLGSSSAISNLIAGYTMTYRRAFKLGDRIRIGETFGEVTETRLQVTHLRSPKNEEIIIPNSQLLNSEIVNYSSLAKQRGLILHTTVGIGYATPWRQVEAMLLAAAERTPGLLREPPPFVLQRKLGDFAVEYEINVHCDEPGGMLRLYTELHRNILDLFNEHGVQIMTPAYEGDPDQPKLVPKEQWYAPPARREPEHPK
jgi:small-conductance mechanosensitive channel